MHVHDAKGRSNHLSLGEGNVDIDKYLSLAKKHNYCIVLEVKTTKGLHSPVWWLKERIYLS